MHPERTIAATLETALQKAESLQLHPNELKTKWNLSYERLAQLIGNTPRTLKRYAKPDSQPPNGLLRECWMLDFWLTQFCSKQESQNHQ